MAKILVLTTDLPYFPGKMGVDYFNLRHLAQSHQVAVVAPCYDSFPADGVANLESFLSGAYFWPRPVQDIPLFASTSISGEPKAWILRLPDWFRRAALKSLVRVKQKPEESFDKLSVLANCAPQLLRAIQQGPWEAIVLIQSSLEPWLAYLPHAGSKFLYLHDLRSDYFERAIPLPGTKRLSTEELVLLRNQEQRIFSHVDVAGFVSELDCNRALQHFAMDCEVGVAPIPVDTDYYTPKPADWPRALRPTILFTGHLAHPPNVDAVLFFLEQIWPHILAILPDASFQAVGMTPAPALQEACEQSPNCELHANVPDIRPYFWNAMVYIVPMRFGGGVRQKIFEAWTMMVPVVCTSMAAEGTGAISGQNCWLEDDPLAFAHRVVHVLTQCNRTEVLQQAKQHVEKNNAVPAAAPKFQQLAETAIRTRQQKPFKVLYDLRWMEIGKAGGIEQATYELLSAIGTLDRRNAFRIFAPRSTCTEWCFPKGFKVKQHFSDTTSRKLESYAPFFANKFAESLGMNPILTPQMRSLLDYNKLDFDIVHSVAGYTHPDLLGFPGVLTINDLQHLHYPEFFTNEEFEERERLYRESASRAQHIICISEFTRQDVHRQYGIPLEKMSTIWIIPSRNIWQPLPESHLQSLLTRMGLTDKFLFFPAHCWPHKNHTRLVEAFHSVVSELHTGTKLVLTGRPFPLDHPAAIYIREHDLGRRIVHLGFRSPLEIRALFHGCLALVFPSLFEGYGMPVAEAIISGKPVICSNTTSLPELAGDAALTFDPHNIHEISASILRIATSEACRTELSEQAKQRRGLFSARKSAVQTLSIYHQVHQSLYKG